MRINWSLVRAGLRSPSNNQDCRKKEKSCKRALLLSVPNSGMHHTLVRKKSEEGVGYVGISAPWRVLYAIFFACLCFLLEDNNLMEKWGISLRPRLRRPHEKLSETKAETSEEPKNEH